MRTQVETGALVVSRGLITWRIPCRTFRYQPPCKAVLAARIDRLSPEEKSVRQTTAVMGVEVPSTPLQAVWELPEEVFSPGPRASAGRSSSAMR